jgi:hypothetical protein
MKYPERCFQHKRHSSVAYNTVSITHAETITDDERHKIHWERTVIRDNEIQHNRHDTALFDNSKVNNLHN